jgi:hypothetical protein
MTEASRDELFPGVGRDRGQAATRPEDRAVGVKDAVRSGGAGARDHVAAADRRRPASAGSIDLRLSEVACRARTSFLPGCVRDNFDQLSKRRIDPTAGAVLEKDCVYIARAHPV